jgi:Protein of unknown function (DUF2589)
MTSPAIEPAAEFQKLPLEMIIATPLVAVAKAQAIAADTTISFIKNLLDAQGKPQSIALSVEKEEGGAKKAVTVQVPLLTMVPVPHLLIDSFTLNFKYEVAQTFRNKAETSGSAGLDVKSGAALSPFVEATFHGNVARSSSAESSTNRGGTLDIMIRASQSAVPVGLERLLTMLSQGISPDK